MKIRSEFNKKFASIKWQITIRTWLILIPCFAISNVVIIENGKTLMERNIRERLKINSELLDFAIQRWDKASKDEIKFLSKHPQVQLAAEKRDRSYSAMLFKNLNEYSKYKAWRLWSTNGDLIDYTSHFNYKINPDVVKNNIINSKFFQRAVTHNISTFDIQKSVITGIPCIEAAYPVYSPSANQLDSTTTGVLNYCLDLSYIGLDSGLNELYKTLSNEMYDKIITDRNILFSFYAWLLSRDSISLTENNLSKFVLLTKTGHLVFPINKNFQSNKTIDTKIPVSTLESARKNGWEQLINLAVENDKIFRKIQIQGTEYYVYKSSVDGIWTSFTLIESEVFALMLGFILFAIIVLQIFTMIIIVIGLYWQAREISEPIDLARNSIKKISDGEFDINIVHKRSDEIGALYDDINSTAVQLRDFIKKVTAHAVTSKQLETANRIQKNFLVEELPESNFYELAATFIPAYEIGADWYDAISMNDKIYFVIADVCDKGVASALFMSVFRTLMRYTLLNYNSDLSTKCDEILINVISLVNNYMATTHEKATMFATVFMASYSYKENTLSYVCAGHELPIIVRAEGLETLKPTGPAIGLFPGAEFKVNQINFYPSDIIFSYTDGLTDARSPENVSWGVENLKNAIMALPYKSYSAEKLLTDITAKAIKHINTAEQFDDLTIFVLKAKNDQQT